MYSIAVIGAGYWGPNLIRNFRANPAWDLVAVCDLDESRPARSWAPARPSRSRPRSSGCSPATTSTRSPSPPRPGPTPRSRWPRFEAGKHVLVEKPLADNAETAAVMVSAAEAAGKVLMIDHTFCYTPGGAVHPRRDRRRRARRHPLHRLDPDQPRARAARRRRVLGPGPARPVDPRLHPARRPARRPTVTAQRRRPARCRQGLRRLPARCRSPTAAIAHVNVNWLSPTKIRQMVIGGSRRTLVWDDMNPAQRISIHDRGVDLRTQAADAAVQREAVTVSYRMGDVVVPGAQGERGPGRRGDRVRRRHRGGPRPADRRTSGPAGAVGAGGRQREPGQRRSRPHDRRSPIAEPGARPHERRST